MNIKTLRRFIRRRLQNIGVPRDKAIQMSENFAYQYLHQGDAGSTTYIKRCGETLIHYLYGTPDKAPWVRTVHRFPSFFAPVKDCGEEVLLRVAKLARAIKFASIRPEQVDKVTLAVVTPYGGTAQAVTRMTDLISIGFSLYGLETMPRMRRDSYKPKLVTRSFKKVQSTAGPSQNVAEPPIRESFQLLADHPEFRVEGYESVFYPINETSVRRMVERLTRPLEDRIPYVGEIHASQEGGGKLRMFASPYTVFQCILYPLHFYLASVRREVPTDCTHDQAEGARRAQEWLNSGRTVHSVDLSTATCRFPLEPQIKLLELLRVPDEEIRLLEYVCRGSWKCGVDVGTAFAMPSLKWSVGQPLGIAPSMSMFSLAHNLLLAGLCVSLRLDPEDSFRVLGDDVVISNTQLAAEYQAVLSAADIPVSTHKSHSSAVYAEFAGYSITRELMVRPGQWRPATPSNMLSLAEELKTPLYGEINTLGETIQKAYLFGVGMYDPTPEEWPMFIKLSTGFALLHLERWTAYRAPLWYYKIMEVADAQCGMLSYHWDEPDFAKAIYSVLFEKIEEIEGDNHGELMQMVYPLYMLARRGHRPDEVKMYDCYQALVWLWDAGVLTQLEYHTLTDKILEVARTLLYMPDKRAEDNELSYIGKQLSKLVKLVVNNDLTDLQWSPYETDEWVTAC